MDREQESSAERLRLSWALQDASRTDDIPPEELNEIQRTLDPMPEYGDIMQKVDFGAEPVTTEEETIRRFQVLIHLGRHTRAGEGSCMEETVGYERRRAMRVRDEAGIQRHLVSGILEHLEQVGCVELDREEIGNEYTVIADARITEAGEATLESAREETPDIIEAAEKETRDYVSQQVLYMRDEIKLAASELGAGLEYADSLVNHVEEEHASWSPLTSDLECLSIEQILKIPGRLAILQAELEEKIDRKRTIRKAA